ncbi:DNA methyltransferase [Sideroxydans sp.]
MNLDEANFRAHNEAEQSNSDEKSVGATGFNPYPEHTTQTLADMISRYERTGRAQNVSFRDLVPWVKMGERATHYIHSYPAKLLPQIAHFFLSAQSLSKEGDIVLDPFGGSGTVALEAILAGRKAYYADANPLARLIAGVKTRCVQTEAIIQAADRVERRYSNARIPTGSAPSVVNLEYWYEPEVIKSLCRIKDAIEVETDCAIKNFLRVSFSSVCRKVSLADPRLSVPVRIKTSTTHAPDGFPDVWKGFYSQVSNNLRRMQNLLQMVNGFDSAFYVGDNARSLRAPTANFDLSPEALGDKSVDLIITSPPYAGAQKYIRASSLSLGWLGLANKDGLKPLENASIGREHFPTSSHRECPQTGLDVADRIIKRIFKVNPLRSVIVATYIIEMDAAIKEMTRVLRPGGHLVLVIGNNEVCGLPFKSSEYLALICEKYGLSLKLKLIDEIKSRGLMTKRNKTASVITREWVLLFEKKAAKQRKRVDRH